MSTVERLAPGELRTLFLFADLHAEQLAWVSEHGWVERRAAGAAVSTEGEPGTCFYVLLSGAIMISRLVQGQQVEVTRTDYRGAYSGWVQLSLDDDEEPNYRGSVHAVTDAEFLVLPSDELGAAFRAWFPMATHLMRGTVLGGRDLDSVVGQRERLLALGRLAAGLTHELNNPAAAASRAAARLREPGVGRWPRLSMLAGASGDAGRLGAIETEILGEAGRARLLPSLEQADREEETGDWLDRLDIPGSWELAPIFVTGGVRLADLERVRSLVDGGRLAEALGWLARMVETETLVSEISEAMARISALLESVTRYAQLGRSPHQWIDIHDGIDSTLAMFGRRLRDRVTLVTEFDRTVPAVLAYPAELNQVWTNLIDNALDAMAGAGTLTIRTTMDADRVLVEVCDTGVGVPDHLHQQIFEPFFTTKPIGEGTGLGLDVAWRIVVTRHSGDLHVSSTPGDTRFRVRLPVS